VNSLSFAKLGFMFLSGLASIAAASAAQPVREISFDRDWKFFRGDISGAEAVNFDDTAWRTLDVPHDWSIEDLPAKPAATPELLAVPGTWRFHPGDEKAWSNPAFDDHDWTSVTLPAAWEDHSNYAEDNVYGWYRRKLEIPAEFKGCDFELVLGKIDDVDEVWLNGQRIGGTGTFPPHFGFLLTSKGRTRRFAATGWPAHSCRAAGKT
jgi:beta-galactosidase